MKNKETLHTIGFILFILFLISACVWWELFKFHDCVNVGHSLAYCIFAGR